MKEREWRDGGNQGDRECVFINKATRSGKQVNNIFMAESNDY